jgi:hypothetical protein
MVKEKPPSQPYSEKKCYIKFNEVIIGLMWDKKRGEPKYDMRNGVLWIGSYIVKKNYEKRKYYLFSMDGRKMSLPIDGFLL